MKSIKRFLARIIFTKEQRDVIYQSLVYSEYKYRKREDVNRASRVHTVLNGVAPVLGIVKMTYTKAEVDEIVDKLSKINVGFLQQKMDEAFREGVDMVMNRAEKLGVVIPSWEFLQKEESSKAEGGVLEKSETEETEVDEK